MRSWSIHVGRLFGVEVRLHLTFLILPLFVFWTEYSVHPSANGPRDLALVGIVLACVAAHEIGHMLVASRAGLIPKAVILLPLSGVTVFDESRAKTTESADTLWRREVRIALVGPLVNLAFAIVAAAVVFAAVPGANLLQWPFLQSSNLPRSLVWANLYLAGLNLLPAYPLDGGRILRAYFARNQPAAATRRAVSISHAMAMILMVAGLFSNTWLTMVGVIIFSAAQLEERAVIFQSVLDNVRLEEVMLTDFATLSPADTLEDALDKAVHSLQDDFPVVRGSDMVGVISRQRILEALRAEGNGYVQAVMNKLFEVSVRQESLASAFRKLTSRNLSIIPVVEDQRLVGIVTLQNLMHSMALLAESRKLRRDESN
jgi:Zn-dependent protease/CBS domain-containing protein